jgi:hypothetical protein
MIAEAEIRGRLREFISNNFLIGKGSSPPQDGDSFLETGLIDSTGVLELVGYNQDTWVRGSLRTCSRESDSIDNLTAYAAPAGSLR